MTAIPKPVRQLDADYLAWIKTQRCYAAASLSTGLLCDSWMDAHHVVPKGGGKTGSKTDDRRCVPACRTHHIYAERWPLRFQRIYDPEALIKKLNAKYDATHKPKPQPPRSITPQLRSLTVRCDCGLEHKITKMKAQFRLTGLAFWCIRQQTWKMAPWSIGK